MDNYIINLKGYYTISELCGWSWLLLSNRYALIGYISATRCCRSFNDLYFNTSHSGNKSLDLPDEVLNTGLATEEGGHTGPLAYGCLHHSRHSIILRPTLMIYMDKI